MKNALSVYSDILILRDETYRALKRSPGAATFIVLMFLAVSLVAGLGKWLALPNELTRPTLAEQVGRASAAVGYLEEDVVPSITESLDSLSRENLSFALGEVLPPDASVTPAALAEVTNRAGLTTRQLINLVSREVDVPSTLAAQLVAQAPSEAVVSQLLSATDLSAVELKGILTRVELQALPAAMTADGGLSNALFGALLSGITQGSGVQQLVTSIALTPERIRDITVGLGLDATTVNRINTRIEAAPEQIQDVLDIAQEELVLLQPPLGVTFSRFINFLGDWLSTPFQLAAAYLPLVLVAMLAARVLGGKGTVTQHIFGMALAVAPAFLLFLTFANDLGLGVSASTQVSINIAGRILGLIAIAWAFLILIKSLSIVHEFSRWRAIATLALTYGIIYVLLPLLGFFATGYLLRG